MRRDFFPSLSYTVTLQETFTSPSHCANAKLWAKFLSERNVRLEPGTLESVQHWEGPWHWAQLTMRGADSLDRPDCPAPDTHGSPRVGAHHSLGRRLAPPWYHWPPCIALRLLLARRLGFLAKLRGPHGRACPPVSTAASSCGPASHTPLESIGYG